MMRIAKITSAILAYAILTGFIAFACTSGAVTESVNFQTPKLQSKEQKLNNINIQYDSINHELLKLHSNDQDKIQKLKAEKEQLEKQRRNLQKQLQAKVSEKAKLKLAAATAVNKITATSTVSAAPPAILSGSHEDWMAAAGIAPSNYEYVDYIVFHESNWDVNAYNASGAYGLCQALPGIKMASAGADWQTNPITQLRWCAIHAANKGGWAASYYFWVANKYW